jgi:hypothetical protein
MSSERLGRMTFYRENGSCDANLANRLSVCSPAPVIFMGARIFRESGERPMQ